MDNAGDWLYIVFLIVAGISSLFSSMKKKKQPTEILGQPGRDINTEPERQPQKGFWEILQEMQEEQKEPPRPVEKTISPVTKKNKQQKKAAPSPFLTAENEIKTQIAAEKADGLVIPEERNILADIEFDNPAELRKAIIYAEILNRKY